MGIEIGVVYLAEIFGSLCLARNPSSLLTNFFLKKEERVIGISGPPISHYHDRGCS